MMVGAIKSSNMLWEEVVKNTLSNKARMMINLHCILMQVHNIIYTYVGSNSQHTLSIKYHLRVHKQPILRWHIGSVPDHLPLDWHTRKLLPTRLKPGLHR